MAGPKKPKFRDIDIKVTKLAAPTPQWPAGFEFQMAGEGVGQGNRLKFKNTNHPGFIVCFNIVDPGDTGCQFLPDPDDAMWVQPSGLANPPCPSSAAYWDEFRAVDVVDHAQDGRFKSLLVYNKNDAEQRFAFTLRFEIPGCNKVVEFDPIGENENGLQF